MVVCFLLVDNRGKMWQEPRPGTHDIIIRSLLSVVFLYIHNGPKIFQS